MPSGSTIRILQGLRENSGDDEKLKIFLELVLREEIGSNRFFRDYYNKFLEKCVNGWDDP